MLPFLDCRTDFRFDYDLCMVIGLNSVSPELSRELVLQKLGNDGLRRVYQKTIGRLFLEKVSAVLRCYGFPFNRRAGLLSVTSKYQEIKFFGSTAGVPVLLRI